MSWSKQTKNSSTFTNISKDGVNVDDLLKEDGFYLLLETGFKIILEQSSAGPTTWAEIAKS